MLRGCAILLTVSGLAMGQAMVQNAAAAAGGAAAAAGTQKIASGLDKILGAAASSASAAAATPAPPAPPPPPPPTAASKRAKPSPYQPVVNRAGGTEMAPIVTPGVASRGVPSPVEVEAVTSGESVPGNPWVSRGHPQPAVPAFTPFESGDGGPVVNRGSRRGGDALPPPPLEAVVTVGKGEVVRTIIAPPPPPAPPPILATAEKLAEIKEGATLESIVAQLGTPAVRIAMYEDGKLSETLRFEAKGSRLGVIQLENGVVTTIEKDVVR